MKKLLITVIMFLGLIPMTTATSFALNKPTHKLINKFIATHSLMGFSLDSYLKVQLGLQSGIATSFDNKKPVDLLGDGGESEDEPMYFRSVNHFHNPITKQGFSDLNHWWALWGFFGLLNGKSSIQWSLLENSQSPGGHYSWPDARNYFYKALTPTDQTTRDQNFADTFRALGQVMHLVEDLSVPEHTRNELHGQSWKYGYENWVEENVKDLSGIVPIFFDPSALGNKNPLVASAPIINLFDNNQTRMSPWKAISAFQNTPMPTL